MQELVLMLTTAARQSGSPGDILEMQAAHSGAFPAFADMIDNHSGNNPMWVMGV